MSSAAARDYVLAKRNPKMRAGEMRAGIEPRQCAWHFDLQNKH
jgi:hypothetical protein